MKATLSVVRVYGTNAGYGRDPHAIPEGSPVVVRAYPRRLWTTTISFGAPEPWVLDAEGLSRAVLRTIFTAVFGRAQKGDPDAVEHVNRLRQSLGPTGAEWRWWVTIASERELEVPDDEWLDLPLIWVSPSVTEGLAREARRDVGRGMDALAGLIGSTLPGAITGAPTLDRVFLRAPGRQPFPLLTPSVFPPSVHVSVASPLDLSGFASMVRRLRPALDRLQGPLYWWARSIEEADEWRRYQFQFLALEILVAKLEPEARTAIMPTLRGGRDPVATAPSELVGDRISIAAKFALVALMLSPETASDDASLFAMLKKERDQLSHGITPVGATLPTEAAGQLLARYLALVLGRDGSNAGGATN